MRKQLWHELANAVFYINFLNLYIKKKEGFNKRLETILQASSFISAVGLFKYLEGYQIFGGLLLIVSFIRLFKHHWITADQVIGNYKSELEFYIDKSRTLEKLWWDLKGKKIIIETAVVELEKYLDAESLLIKTIKHPKVKDKKLQRIAENETLSYLRIKFNS